MLYTAIATAFLMGLAGGFHCLAMCLLPCHTLIGAQPSQNTATRAAGARDQLLEPHVHPVHLHRPIGGDAVLRADATRWFWRAWCFHAGRLFGYAVAGGLVAWAMGNFALLSQSSALLQPLWSGAHALVLVWGLAMLLKAQQPVWLERVGRQLWGYVRPLAAHRYGLILTSIGWVFLPCGLLYSALLLAALTQGFWHGAAAMAAFGVGSGIWLVLGSGVWQGFSHLIRQHLHQRWLPWGVRLAGLLLMVSAAFALWMEWFIKPGLWCVAG